MKRIRSIEIRNSPFYEDTRIEFSDRLNCIMGGRGTGKSTLLYFIKSCIFQDAEKDSDINNILKSNLGSGEIQLEIEANNGSLFNITKTFNDDPQPYRLPSAEFTPISKIFDEIECDFYETGKIEEIGRSKIDRLQLLDKRIKPQIQEYEAAIKDLQIDLDVNAQDIKSFNQRLKQIDDFLSQYEDIEKDFEAHRKQQPIGLLEKEKKEFEEADFREKVRKEERRFFNKTIELFLELNNDFQAHKTELEMEYTNATHEKDDFINKDIMNAAMNDAGKALDIIQGHINSVLKVINDNINKLDVYRNEITEKHDLQQAEFIKLKQKFEQNREYINRYHSLSKKLNEKQTLQKDKKDLVTKRKKFKAQRTELIKKLNNLKQDIFKVRLKSIKELNESFEGMIVINLTYAGITDEFEERLREGLRGSGMRYNELIPRIVESFSSDEFANIIHNSDIDQLKSVMGIDISRSEALVNALYETDDIYEIERMYCNDLPEFKLRIHEGDYKEENYRKSDELSMGQRCTTVLPIIFAVSTNPLIIDQPEDNLDNKYITDHIHKIIRKQKEGRQLIFITHNPNIPVLSEAEKNIFLKYDRKASVDVVGTVDEIKDNIIGLLEGGKSAFKTRMTTYGY